MAEFPALPLWTDAYLGDTTHLTTIEHGAYLLLLMTAWRTRDCALPDDDKLLARYARCGSTQWKRLRPILAPFFRIENGSWVQARLSDERNAVQRFRENQSEKGKKGGQAKSLKYSNRHLAGAGNGQSGAVAGAKPESDLPYSIPTIQLDKESNCAPAVDPDKQFWDMAKDYLGAGKASLIGQWVRDHGREATASAIAAAQVERAVDPVQFIVGRFRHQAKAEAGQMERPIC